MKNQKGVEFIGTTRVSTMSDEALQSFLQWREETSEILNQKASICHYCETEKPVTSKYEKPICDRCNNLTIIGEVPLEHTSMVLSAFRLKKAIRRTLTVQSNSQK